MPTRPFSFLDELYSSPEYGPGLADLATPEPVRKALNWMTGSIPNIVELKKILAKARGTSDTQYLDSALGHGAYTQPVSDLEKGALPNVADESALIPETPLQIGLTAAGGLSGRASALPRAARSAERALLSTGVVTGVESAGRKAHAGDRAGAVGDLVGAGTAGLGMVAGEGADASARRNWLQSIGAEEDQYGNIWKQQGGSYVRLDDSGQPLPRAVADQTPLREPNPLFSGMWGDGGEEGTAGRIGRYAPEPPPEGFTHPLLDQVRGILGTTDINGREQLARGAITGRVGGTKTIKSMADNIRQTMIDAGITPNAAGRLGDLPIVSSRGQSKGMSNARNLEGLIYEAIQDGRIPTPEPPPPAPPAPPPPAPPSRARGPVLGPPIPTMVLNPTTGEMEPQLPASAQLPQPRGSRSVPVPASGDEPLPTSKVNLGPAAPSTRIPGKTPLFLDIPAQAAAEQKMMGRWQKANNKITNDLPLSDQPEEPQSVLAGLGGLSRNIMSSFDFSPARQMMMGLPRNPLIGARSLGAGLKGMFSPEEFQRQQNAMKATPGWKILADHGVVTQLSENSPLSHAEEGFQGWASRSPLVSWFVNPSERGQIGALNNFRVNLANNFLKNGLIDAKNPKEQQALAQMIGTFSGRGTWGEGANQWMPAINAFLYSGRYLKAKLDVVNPLYYGNLYQKSPAVAKEAAKTALTSAATYLGAATMMKYGLESSGIGSVGLDPRDRRTFLKASIGNTHFDVSGGMGGVLSTAAQVLSGQAVRGRGDASSLQDLNRTDEVGTLEHFARGQLSPLASGALDYMTGKKVTGEKMVGAQIPFTNKRVGGPLAQVVAERSLPLGLAGMIDAYQNKSGIPGVTEKSGPMGALMATPDLLGINTTTYDPNQDINSTIDPELLARWDRTYGESHGTSQNKAPHRSRRF